MTIAMNSYRVLAQVEQPRICGNCKHLRCLVGAWWLCAMSAKDPEDMSEVETFGTCDQHEYQGSQSSSKGKARAKPKPPENAIEREYETVPIVPRTIK